MIREGVREAPGAPGEPPELLRGAQGPPWGPQGALRAPAGRGLPGPEGSWDPAAPMTPGTPAVRAWGAGGSGAFFFTRPEGPQASYRALRGRGGTRDGYKGSFMHLKSFIAKLIQRRIEKLRVMN